MAKKQREDERVNYVWRVSFSAGVASDYVNVIAPDMPKAFGKGRKYIYATYEDGRRWRAVKIECLGMAV